MINFVGKFLTRIKLAARSMHDWIKDRFTKHKFFIMRVTFLYIKLWQDKY